MRRVSIEEQTLELRHTFGMDGKTRRGAGRGVVGWFRVVAGLSWLSRVPVRPGTGRAGSRLSTVGWQQLGGWDRKKTDDLGSVGEGKRKKGNETGDGLGDEDGDRLGGGRSRGE